MYPPIQLLPYGKYSLLKELKKFKDARHQEYGIELLGIFGSYARGDAGTESDVDVVVQLNKQDLFRIIPVG